MDRIAWMHKMLCDAIDSHRLLEQKLTNMEVIHLTFSHVLPDEDTVSLFSPDNNKQMEKKRKWVCVCAVPVSSPQGLWGTTH